MTPRDNTRALDDPFIADVCECYCHEIVRQQNQTPMRGGCCGDREGPATIIPNPNVLRSFSDSQLDEKREQAQQAMRDLYAEISRREGPVDYHDRHPHTKDGECVD